MSSTTWLLCLLDNPLTLPSAVPVPVPDDGTDPLPPWPK